MSWQDDVTLERVREAAVALSERLHRTPLVRSQYLSGRLGAEVWLKLENQQKTGSFKPRGAFTTMIALSEAERRRGIITISAGNHAQAAAFAAEKLGVDATVVMPAAASAVKVAATRGYGAEVVLHGDVHQAFDKLAELKAQRGLTMVHPFDSPHVTIGTATVATEIIEDLPEVDHVIVAIGGGGLASGVAFGITELCPNATVTGVEPTGAAAMARSRRAGALQTLETTDTIADGLAPPFVGALPFAIANDRIETLVEVEDADIIDAMVVLFERVKTVAEPAGAAALGALLSGKAAVNAGSRVVVIVSGGNVSAAQFAELITR